MTCSTCGTVNPAGASFCMNCGSRLLAACDNCGSPLPEMAAFCPACGHGVVKTASPPAPASVGTGDRVRRYVPPELLATLESAAVRDMEGERRTVTMLFSDVKGSTTAAERLDPEEWADIMNGAFEHLIAPIYRYEGTLARLMGDAILAFFGAPIAHEDDPERAVRAGLEILEEIRPFRERVRHEWGFDFEVRVGINTGLVVVGAVGSDLRVDYTAMGDAVNVAARMEQTAAPGTVQISAATRRLVPGLFEIEDLGEVEVKGREDRVRSFRVTRALAEPGTRRGIEGLRAPLIGRDDELATLRQAFAALDQGQGRIVSVMGEAGMGKSRLVTELREGLAAAGELGGVEWVEGRALSYHTTTPYAPIQGILRGLIGSKGEEPPELLWELLADLVGRAIPGRVPEVAPFLAILVGAETPSELRSRVEYLEPPRLRESVFGAVLELFTELAERRALVLVLEDLHWADSATVELLTDLLDLAERTTLLLILLFRPRRQDVSWRVHEAAERDHPHLYTALPLGPLPDEETRMLVASLLAVEGLTEPVRDLILRKAEGNPFFVEEVIRSLLDAGLVTQQGDRWVVTGNVSDIAVPDTLSAVLTTRLDQLDEQSKAVVQAASVVGREFRYDELAAVLSDLSGLEEALVELQRRELLREVARLPKRAFRFKHVLVQEAAYATLLLKRRVQLHAALADFLERLQPERVEDVARHLLAARQPARALPYLVAAGERAIQAYALTEAIERVERALEMMGEPAEPSLLRRALETLGKAKELQFDFAGALAAYGRLRAEGERRGDPAMRVSGLNKLALVQGMVFEAREEALSALSEAEEAARRADDGAGLVESCMIQCALRTGYAEFDQVEHYMAEVTRLGEELGMTEPTLYGMTHFANTLVYLTRFEEGLEQAEKALVAAEEAHNLKFQAELLTFAIPTCLMRNGDMPGALAAVERGMEIALRIGDRGSEMLAACVQGKVAMGRGDFESALSLFRRATAAADATGLPFMQAVGRCVTGTCYQQIGGPMLAQAAQLHDNTLELMELPTGKMSGAWVWSEIGECALAIGKVAKAKRYFELALTEPTTPIYLMRPMALAGLCKVMLAEGRIEDAGRSFAELDEYVSSRRMQDKLPLVLATRASLEAVAGDHEAALVTLAELEEMVGGAGMNRLLLDVLALRASSLEALGDHEGAGAVRVRAHALAGEIAAAIGDLELRRAFLTGMSALLTPHEGMEPKPPAGEVVDDQGSGMSR